MARSKARSQRQITLVGFLIRLVASLFLVLVTYNPTSYSFIQWFWDAVRGGSLDALHVFVGVLLVVGWAILIRATFNALGGFGLTLGVVVFAALIWLLIDLGLLTGSGLAFYTWVTLVGLAAILAVGLCWSHIWRRLTGQYTVEDVEDD